MSHTVEALMTLVQDAVDKACAIADADIGYTPSMFKELAAIRAYAAALAQPPQGWKPIESAPKDRAILAFNAVTGWYKTRHKDAWPMYGWIDNDAIMEGCWYPEPTHWTEIPASPLPEAP